ncbi:MAG: helix-turn-helix domain-containing protein [Clostridia bacterium]|nr:helix-turn-helix domain-containing protein [Clostridia bacterium]
MIEFGEQLRRARETKGLTQQSLAEQLFVTRQTVSRWECGDRYPDLLTTKRISQVLEVSLDDLLSDNEMTKIVEKNPVIEKKSSNNLMIALYTLIIFSYVFNIASVFSNLFKMDTSVDMTISIPVETIVGLTLLIVIIVTFIYGMVNAIKGTLNPKRMGFVNIVYLISDLVRGVINAISTPYLNGSGRVIAVLLILPQAVCAAVIYKMFVSQKDNEMYPRIIYITSIIEIIYSVYIECAICKYSAYVDPMGILTECFLGISLIVLIIYQTRVLSQKRQLGLDIKKCSSIN